MKQKHFTFDLDYFPISTSNIFQSIKIEQKNRNKNENKNSFGLKRFSIKNQLKLEEMPQIMFFQKSHKKSRTKAESGLMTPFSNKTNKSINDSIEEITWSFEKKNTKKTNQKEKRVQSCPKVEKIKQKELPQSKSNYDLKFNSVIGIDKCLSKSNIEFKGTFSHKKSQKLESLQECQSEFDESSNNSSFIPEILEKNPLKKIQIRSKKPENKKCTISQKNNKSKKSIKSNNSKGNQINPQIGSNKQKNKKDAETNVQQKNHNKLWNSLLIDENNKKTQKKFISLNRKSYYLIGSKNNKNRSLNKQKKGKKNNSLKQEANIILTNGDCTEQSSSIPSNCRNTSLTSTVNSKGKRQRKSMKQNEIQCLTKRTKVNKQIQIRGQMLEIVKKTGQILSKYKGQCEQLKRQKDDYERKYQQAMNKLNRIRDEITTVIQI